MIVDLPGVKDQQDALDAVDIAGIVSLRPVLQCAVTGDTSSTVEGDGSTPPASTTPGDTTPGSSVDSSTPTTPTIVTPTATTEPTTTDTATAATPAGFRRAAPTSDAPTTTEVPTTTTAVARFRRADHHRGDRGARVRPVDDHTADHRSERSSGARATRGPACPR